MKEEFNIEEMIDGLKGSFDFREPREGHQSRFQAKLEGETQVVYTMRRNRSINWWRPLAIAASIALVGILGRGDYARCTGHDQSHGHCLVGGHEFARRFLQQLVVFPVQCR